MSDLYDEDILLWSERQAALLQRVAAGEPLNERPDWQTIIEKVESVGRAPLHAVEPLHPRLTDHNKWAAKTWMGGPSPTMTAGRLG